MVSHCCYNLHFLNDIGCEASLICLFTICISSLVKYVLMSLAHFLIRLFVFLLLRFKSPLYILDSSPLSDKYFADIFSQSVSCLFILLTLSLEEQKLLILLNSNLSIISFIHHAFGVLSEKS